MSEKVFAFNDTALSVLVPTDRERFRSAFVAFHEKQTGSDPSPSSGLGRAEVQMYQFPNGESAVFRAYRRGGWFSKLVTRDFFNPDPSCIDYRPLAEYRVLSFLRNAGVRVPQPLAIVIEKRFLGRWYRGSIATGKIERAQNLLDLARERSHGALGGAFGEYCYLAGLEAAKMLRAGVFHRDLHLGNVLVSDGTKVWLIDFDKATVVSKSAFASAAEKLFERWCRSTKKHGVGVHADEAFRAGLRLPPGGAA
ncbi:MAG: lipopolysaccharide kinase InaA family protein [Bdellovibrionota bacterium]